MKLNFRQGIWKARSISSVPNFLEYSPVSNSVTIDITTTPLTASIAARSKDYLIDERTTVTDAWGPLVWNPAWGIADPSPTYYLYWSISLASGVPTYGFTPRVPIYSFDEPLSPDLDQHWFDKNENIFKVWDGAFWRPQARLFAGSFNGAITHLPFGSQAGLSFPGALPDQVDAGYILFGMDMKGVRSSDATFVTTAQGLVTYHGSFTSSIRLEQASSTFIADEPIPAFRAVTNNGDGSISLGAGTGIDKRPIGVSYQDAVPGDPVDVITGGFVYNDLWTWDVSLGKEVYCDSQGNLIQTAESSGFQKVGSIFDSRSILIDIDPPGSAGGSSSLLTDIPIIGTTVGAVGPGYTFPTGMSLTQLVAKISQKIISPSLVLSGAPTPQLFEIGTIISPLFSIVYVPGNAGSTVDTRLRKNSSTISTTLPYTDSNVQLTATPVTYNVERDYAAGSFNAAGDSLPSGTVTSNSLAYSGTRRAFYGTPVSTPIASAGVRALSGSFNSGNNADVDSAGINQVAAPTPSFTITIPIGATRVVFAYPDTSRAVASVRYQELADSEVKGNFTLTTLVVDGANGYSPVTYKVYTYVPVEPFSIINHYKVFI